MREKKKVRFSLKSKLFTMIALAVIPLLTLIIFLIISLSNYSNAYNKIVSNLTVANNYNLNFKEEIDESIYKLAVETVTFDNIDEDQTLRNPYAMIDDLRNEFTSLMEITTDSESLSWLESLLRNLETLEDRVDDIKRNIDQGGQYAENMKMLDNNIYILTDLIQDDIQYYIYYQTRTMELLRLELNDRINSFMFFVLFLTILIAVAEFFTATIIVNSITSPISELCQVTESIAEGNFESRAGVYTQDEVALLAESTNDMARHLQVMVDHIKEDERKMRHTELRLLQEQINPHFLYNTLDTIVWLIESGDMDRAVDMVVSLSAFFRLVLSKGREYITIREEEQHIRSYLEIQQVRYHDILEYDINIDQEVYGYRILKLTLQPLIENSLYHGIKYKRAKGTIFVNGHLIDNKIILTVRDDGVGMDEDTLDRLRDEISKPCKETESGFGLANVNERIKMNFGSDYGMEIESRKGEGTLVTITIPATE